MFIGNHQIQEAALWRQPLFLPFDPGKPLKAPLISFFPGNPQFFHPVPQGGFFHPQFLSSSSFPSNPPIALIQYFFDVRPLMVFKI
ncbi:MAG TPA: hypothetical protein PLZ34_05125, partial [Prolixibacteraceae bacterium]|nr:hypothetical protein [Prolixibacteraceae bacterium]HOS91592.1 hypothetical protein [Prolixibacteraceae bacterium]HQH75807.1 hypothetical protein [Prolixibacteraceae bacterium]HQJ86838.1 hypothetical protein [Prolixibacteraceae bacterium]